MSGSASSSGTRNVMASVEPGASAAREPEADLVPDDMRRRIDREVQHPPQGNPHRRIVRLSDRLIGHDALLIPAG
ncbi:MAG TPA: hypothetical protein VFZ03_11250 [Dongiaceae bacterium]